MPYPATAQAQPQVEKNGLVWYRFPLFAPFADRFQAAFSTRLGGVSRGPFASLNLGVGRDDDPAAVRENFARFGAAVGMDPARMVFSRQTHTTNLLLADSSYAGQGLVRERTYQDIDGLVTGEAELPLVTFYADCTPLLFYAADRHLAAAAHAGWRGTVADMAGATVRRLQGLGADPRHIYAVIGPAAGPCCYQVSEDVAACFRRIDPATARPDPAAPGKSFVDLWLANRLLLQRAGLPEENIAVAGLCTICHPDLFYSHRAHGNDRGAMVGAVMLKAKP